MKCYKCNERIGLFVRLLKQHKKLVIDGKDKYFCNEFCKEEFKENVETEDGR